MRLALAVLLVGFVSLTTAVPTWIGLNTRSSIGSLVPGAAYIEALGAVRGNQLQLKHLTVPNPGQPGNLTVTPGGARSPPLFYINRNQLWQFHNESAIYPVNVMNATKTSEVPYQLVVGEKKEGITSGMWRWHGTMLFYDLGSRGSTGLYFACRTEQTYPGIFLFLEPAPTPEGCQPITLHSFSRIQNL